MGAMGRRANTQQHVGALQSIRALVAALHESARAVEHSTGVTNAQLFILRELATTDGLSINDLASRALTGQNAISTIVTRLGGRGLVRRQRATDDGRRVLVSLTPAGRRLVERAPEPPTARLMAALVSMTPEDGRPAGAQRPSAHCGDGGSCRRGWHVVRADRVINSISLWKRIEERASTTPAPVRCASCRTNPASHIRRVADDARPVVELRTDPIMSERTRFILRHGVRPWGILVGGLTTAILLATSLLPLHRAGRVDAFELALLAFACFAEWSFVAGWVIGAVLWTLTPRSNGRKPAASTGPERARMEGFDRYRDRTGASAGATDGRAART